MLALSNIRQHIRPLGDHRVFCVGAVVAERIGQRLFDTHRRLHVALGQRKASAVSPSLTTFTRQRRTTLASSSSCH